MSEGELNKDTNKIIEERKEKLKKLREKGDPYPNNFERTHFAEELQSTHINDDKDFFTVKKLPVSCAGRIILKRVMGKASFCTILDMTGTIQIFINEKTLGKDTYDNFKNFDLGDIIGVKGDLFKTNTGELSIRTYEIRLLSKSLRPLPEKFHGLADTEQKYRQRYLDLITSQDTRNRFKLRSEIIQSIRNFFISRNFLEVETPMMQPIPGGANARPFRTHHNALDMELFLRIAPELYLKRLLVGGFEQIFEINRNFRNEGISTKHNPEFTMLEFYIAYKDFIYLMDLTEDLFRKIAKDTLGTLKIRGDNYEVDLGDKFERLSITEAIHKYNKTIPLEKLSSRDYLRELLASNNEITNSDDSIGKMQFQLFETITEDKLIQPTFIIEHPTEVSPLARKNHSNPNITDRFELFVGGRELANGFSELNDPEDQANRFKQQAQSKSEGDEEAMYYDKAYIKALQYGMPPAAGEGIGIDRLVMFLSNSKSIRDVILFPQLKNAKD